MEAGIKSLVRSVLAFVGFWLVFLSGTIINAVIPLKQLQRLAVLNFLITDGMVEFQTQLVRSLTHTSSRGSFVGAIWTLFGSATFSFLRYFKEIFVLVTLFHFTPLLEGIEVFLVIPRWLRRFFIWVGIFKRKKAFTGQSNDCEDDDYYDFDESVDYSSEPPELEDCSAILLQPSPQISSSRRKQFQQVGSSQIPVSTQGSQKLKGSLLFPSDISTDSGSSSLSKNMSDRTSHSSPLQSHVSEPAPTIPARSPPLSPQRSKDRYVYDPVFGVIPRETRDLWQAQESESVQREQALLEAARLQHTNKDPLPPVRFSKQHHKRQQQK